MSRRMPEPILETNLKRVRQGGGRAGERLGVAVAIGLSSATRAPIADAEDSADMGPVAAGEWKGNGGSGVFLPSEAILSVTLAD